MLTEENIKNRKKGIGASEAAIVLGLNEHISPYELWLIKTGRKEPEDISNLPPVYWGNVHEDSIAKHYEKLMNCKVRRMNNTIFHKEYPFMLCHIDRKIEGLPKIIECKFAMLARDQWGPSGSDIVPLSYIVQVQYQLAVTGYQEADLAALIMGFDYRVYNFKREEKIIEKITEEVKKFWKLVETDTPPPLRDRNDAQMAYPFSNGNYKEAEPEIVNVIEEFRQIRAKTKEMEEYKEKLSDKITLFLQDAEGIRMQNEILATWKPTVRGNKVLKVMDARL